MKDPPVVSSFWTHQLGLTPQDDDVKMVMNVAFHTHVGGTKYQCYVGKVVNCFACTAWLGFSGLWNALAR